MKPLSTYVNEIFFLEFTLSFLSVLCFHQICMNKCHTLFVSLTGNVWSCGLGQGGRLGLSSEETVLIPRKIVFPNNVSPNSSSSSNSLFCMKASAGQDHSIFICNDNQVRKKENGQIKLNYFRNNNFFMPTDFHLWIKHVPSTWSKSTSFRCK